MLHLDDIRVEAPTGKYANYTRFIKNIEWFVKTRFIFDDLDYAHMKERKKSGL
jgi:hypothetical protein